jgi:hypothetical protein
MNMLRGYEGATAVAARLRDALYGLLQQVDEDDKSKGAPGAGRYLVFAARNKATGSASASSAPNSPRKRRGSTKSPVSDMQMAGGVLADARHPPDKFAFPADTSAAAGFAKSGVQAAKAAGAWGGAGGGGGAGSSSSSSSSSSKRVGATASHLHRNMLDRTMANKRHKIGASAERDAQAAQAAQAQAQAQARSVHPCDTQSTTELLLALPPFGHSDFL